MAGGGGGGTEGERKVGQRKKERNFEFRYVIQILLVELKHLGRTLKLYIFHR